MSVIATPVQKTLLAPSGLCVAHDESPLGTSGCPVTTSREYLLLQARTIWPTASVTISGLSRRSPTRSPFARPTSMPTARAATIATGRLWLEPTPAIRLPPAAMTAGVERSMPPCMTTSIWPSAATASTVVWGKTYDHDVVCRASGAMNAATTTSTTVANHTGRNRAAPMAFAARVLPIAPAFRPNRGGDEGLAATTSHFEQVRVTVSMLA